MLELMTLNFTIQFMIVDKFTKIEKAFLKEKIDGLSGDSLTSFRIEGIFWMSNSLLTSVLVVKMKDMESGRVKYIPFRELDVKSLPKFKHKYEFIHREEVDNSES